MAIILRQTTKIIASEKSLLLNRLRKDYQIVYFSLNLSVLKQASIFIKATKVRSIFAKLRAYSSRR